MNKISCDFYVTGRKRTGKSKECYTVILGRVSKSVLQHISESMKSVVMRNVLWYVASGKNSCKCFSFSFHEIQWQKTFILATKWPERVCWTRQMRSDKRAKKLALCYDAYNLGPVHTERGARRNNAYASYWPHCSWWECSHSSQATTKDLHVNLPANLLTHPVSLFSQIPAFPLTNEKSWTSLPVARNLLQCHPGSLFLRAACLWTPGHLYLDAGSLVLGL